MIKIKANKLKDFLIKTTADGLVSDAKLIFSVTGLKMQHKDEPGVICIVGLLDKSNFNEYEELILDVKSTKTLINALKTFKDNMINIVKKDNMAKILDENGGFDLALAEKIICYKESQGELAYKNKILVKKSMVDTIVERSSIVASDEVIILNKDKELSFSIGKESDLANSKAISNVEEELKTSFDLAYFKSITAKLDPIFDFSIGVNGMPSRFEEKTDKYSITYYITPISEKKEDKITEEPKEAEKSV